MRLPFKPQGVIFDLDGVLLDTMKYHFAAWERAFREAGINVDRLVIYLREGEKGEVTTRSIMEKSGRHPSEVEVSQLLARKERIFQDIARAELFPGVRELLTSLWRKGYLLGLVTGTSRSEVEKILPQSLREKFRVIITGDVLREGKPHPEPYLVALKGLGLSPDEVVVIENAPNGIRSAKGAGLFCIALTTSLGAEYLQEADMVFDSLWDALQIVLED
ncbi:MAG: HAD family hydrolase [Acidobacteriota bacterium]